MSATLSEKLSWDNYVEVTAWEEDWHTPIGTLEDLTYVVNCTALPIDEEDNGKSRFRWVLSTPNVELLGPLLDQEPMVISWRRLESYERPYLLGGKYE